MPPKVQVKSATVYGQTLRLIPAFSRGFCLLVRRLSLWRRAPPPNRYRRVAGFDPDIDHRDAAALDALDRVAQRARQFVGPADRAEPVGALAARQHAEVGFGVGDALADPAVATGRLRWRAMRSWCSSSLKNELLLETTTSSGMR